MQFEAIITHNLDELAAAQAKTAQAMQDVVDAANASITQSLGKLNEALAAEENVTLVFGVDFTKVEPAVPTPPITPATPVDSPAMTADAGVLANG